MGRPLLELHTDSNGVLHGARETGYKTTSASGADKASTRADGLTAAELDEGELPERFQSLDMAALRQILSPAGFKAPMSNDQLLAEWTGPRLRDALKFAKLNTAPGPSGCSYKVLFHSSDAFLGSIAAFMRACVRCKRIPTAARHSYVRLVPKSGAGGATLEGARQICLIEVLVKLISADIGRSAMAHWEQHGYLDPAQTGFRRFRNAADVTAAVNAVMASHRRAGTPLYVISGDIEKAFQRVPHWALERALRRLGFSTEAAKFWMETDRSRDGPVATCQFWTDHGLTDSFDVEAGARMGEAGSAIKFLVWMDALLAWLRSRQDRGLQFSVQTDGGEVAVDLGVIAYADDLLIIARTLQEAQAILSSIDTFLSAFGVNLQPSKSVALKVGGAWLPDERLCLVRDGRPLPLKLAAPHEGVRYLGVWLQADGGWSSMEAQIRHKVCKWMSALRVAGRSVTAEHADLFVRSKVGGLMRFAFAAAPLSHQLAAWLDDKIGRAVVGRTGGAVGENKFICVRDAFLSREEGGMGLDSMVDLRRTVILGRTLLRLSRAAVQSGADAAHVRELVVERAWLLALDSRSRLGGNEGAGLWQPSEPSANGKIFDHIDAARSILAELKLRVRDDRARPRPLRRRLWDIPTESVFLAIFAGSPGSSLALQQHRSHLTAFNKHEWRLPSTASKRYLSSLLNYSGQRLQSAATIFNSAPPRWFKALEEFLIDPLQSGRMVKKEWQTASREEAAPPAGGHATLWTAQPRETAGSTIWVCEEPLAFPPSTPGQYSEAPQHEVVGGSSITVTYESMTDGTGSGHGGFAFKVTLDSRGRLDENSDQELGAHLEEVGWTAAPPRSDRAELAGLIHQLSRAPDQVGVRLLSDCLSMLLLARWASSASLDKILGHEHRGLLLEWRRLCAQRDHPPLLGWVRGHTNRQEWPYPAQIACDAAAAWTAEHGPDEAWQKTVPKEEATFVLWDDVADRPLLGGWASAIQSRCKALRLQTIGTRRGAGPGARQWHRVRDNFVQGGEWDRRRLRARACPTGRARTAAQADTLWGPGRRCRWDDEQPYRRQSNLSALERSCSLCGGRFTGSWEHHITVDCQNTAPVWERAEAVIGQEWAALCAWDFAEAEHLFGLYQPLWRRWRAGEEIAGFSLQSSTTPSAIVKDKLCARDGEPTVVPVESVQRCTAEYKTAARRAADADGRLQPEGAARQAPQSIPVLRHRDGLTVLPMKFLELWHGFAGRTSGQDPSEDFSEMMVSLLTQESQRAVEVAASRSRAAKHDFWCLWGGFMAWMRRQCNGELAELFTGMLNRTGPWSHLFTADAGDRAWGAQTDAWRDPSGSPRAWGAETSMSAWLSGNPPYSRAEVLDFCSWAASAARPLVGIIPRFSDGIDNITDVLQQGGLVAAHFRAGTLAFTPFGHWFGRETRGDHAARRADLEVLFVTWQAPDLSETARRELAELVSLAGVSGGWPLISSEHPWALSPPPSVQADPVAVARAGFLGDKAVNALALQSAPQDFTSDSDSSQGGHLAPLPPPLPRLAGLMGGPWRRLRWWDGKGLGSPPDTLSPGDREAWCRRLRWGSVPIDLEELCRACGMSWGGRRRFLDRSSRAIRSAAFQAVSLGRAEHACRRRRERAEAGAPASSSSSSAGSSSEGDGIAGDRGVWQGSERVGNSELRIQQDAAHQSQVRGMALGMASARREAARAAALADHVAAATPGTGHFHPPRRGIPHASGTTVQFPPRGGSTSDLTYPELRSVEAPQTSWQERTADTAANLQLWSRLERWWRWDSTSSTRGASRFQSLRAWQCDPGAELICGVTGCSNAAVRRAPPTALPGRARCRQHRLLEHGDHTQAFLCELCGCSGREVSSGWCSIGRWSVICGKCRPRIISTVRTSTDCDGGCGRPGAPTPDGSRGCTTCSSLCHRTVVWLARAWRLWPLALRWMGLAFEAVPIVTARRFCVERALSWEAEARSRAPNGELPFPGNAIEWESWRRPLADLLLHTGLLDPVRWESRRELEWPSGPALVALSGSEDESNSVGAADPAWTALPASGSVQPVPWDAPGRTGRGRRRGRGSRSASVGARRGPMDSFVWVRSAAVPAAERPPTAAPASPPTPPPPPSPRPYLDEQGDWNVAWTGYQFFDLRSEQGFAAAFDGDACSKCSMAVASFPGHFALTCTAGHTLCGPCGGFHTIHQAARPRRPLRCPTCVAARRAEQELTFSGPLPPPPPPPPPSAGDAQGAGAAVVRPSPAHSVRGSGDSAGSWRGGRRRPGASRTASRIASCRGPGPQECRGHHRGLPLRGREVTVLCPSAGARYTLTRAFLARWTVEPD